MKKALTIAIPSYLRDNLLPGWDRHPTPTQVQRLAVDKPATGLLVLQTDALAGFYYNAGRPTGAGWLNPSVYSLQQHININDKWISHSGNDSGLFVVQQGPGIGKLHARQPVDHSAGRAGSKLTTFRTSQGVGV
jgi:hypothetical protein